MAGNIIAGEWLPTLDIQAPGRQRRLTVFFRLLLLIPQAIVLWLLGILAAITVIIGWFAALFLGRLPGWAASYLSAYIAYSTRVTACAMLLVDRYPPLAMHADRYPVQVELRPGHLNRLAVFFRLILIIPAAIVVSIVTTGWWVVALITWLVVLIAGEMPAALFEATSAIVRYGMRYAAYGYLVTSAYPKHLFGDAAAGAVSASPGPPAELEPVMAGPSSGAAGPASGPRRSATRPLILSDAGRILLIVFIIVGILAAVGGSLGGDSAGSSDSAAPAALVHAVGSGTGVHDGPGKPGILRPTALDAHPGSR